LKIIILLFSFECFSLCVFTVLSFFLFFIVNACCIVLDDIYVISRYLKGFSHVFVNLLP